MPAALITCPPPHHRTAGALTQLQGLTRLSLEGIGCPPPSGLLQAASQLPQLLELASPATACELEQLQQHTADKAQPAEGSPGDARQGEAGPQQQPAAGAPAFPALRSLHITLVSTAAAVACAPPSLPHLRSFSLTQAHSTQYSECGYLTLSLTTQHTRQCEGGSWASESSIKLGDNGTASRGAGELFREVRRQLVQSGSPPVTAASVSVHLRPGLRSLQQLVEQLEEVAPGLRRLELDPGCRLASEPEMGLPVRACMAATLAGWRRWQLLLVLLHHCWLQGLKVLGTAAQVCSSSLPWHCS